MKHHKGRLHHEKLVDKAAYDDDDDDRYKKERLFLCQMFLTMRTADNPQYMSVRRAA